MVDEDKFSGDTCVVHWVLREEYIIDCEKAVESQTVWVRHVVGDIIEENSVVGRQRVGPVEEQCFRGVVRRSYVLSALVL